VSFLTPHRATPPFWPWPPESLLTPRRHVKAVPSYAQARGLFRVTPQPLSSPIRDGYGQINLAYVFQLSDISQKPTRLAHLPTAPRARTGLFIAGLRRLAVAPPHTANRPAAVLLFGASPGLNMPITVAESSGLSLHPRPPADRLGPSPLEFEFGARHRGFAAGNHDGANI